MTKLKVKTLIGATIAITFFLIVSVAFLFYAFPQWVLSATGLGPYEPLRILTWCALLTAVMLLVGWLIEKAFERAGRAGFYLHWGVNQQQAATPFTETLFRDGSESEKVFNNKRVSEHLRLRYGRRWKNNIRIWLVQGKVNEVEKAAPGLSHDLWQEMDNSLLIYGGDAQSDPDVDFIQRLKRLRQAKPVDGIVQVIDVATLPGEAEHDAWLRYRQKADWLLGWQAPVWLWLISKETGCQQGREHIAVGALFGPDATAEQARNTFARLVPQLRQSGISQILNNPQHDWYLRLSLRLTKDLKQPLHRLVSGLIQRADAYRLRGVMFSPELAAASNLPNTALVSPTWKAVIEDGNNVRPRKLTFDGSMVLRLLLLAFTLWWAVGSGVSLIVNRTQIYQIQETARQAADNRQPLTERLRHQLVLQQAIARLQHRVVSGAPWYTRFGLNQDRGLLAALWPLYARNNTSLMRDALAERLEQLLQAYINLPPASDARIQQTPRAYDALKSYLMLARPEKADAVWLAQYLPEVWPQREGVGAWQVWAPKLLSFYAQHLPAHPQWKIQPDNELVSTVRQILLRQIGQRNAEAGLYQGMLQRIASNWPDLTLDDLTGDSDAATVFSTDVVVPGVFTRQAWEEQVQSAIDEVVKARRGEIDWVLTDKTFQPASDISPEALRARLVARYFADFGNAWLGMVNSIQWREASSLSEAIAQLTLVADVRQSPLVALMNTLAWQGGTGEQREALADTLIASAKQLIGHKKHAKHFIEQMRGPQGPLARVFGPLKGLMEGKEGAANNSNLSFQSWLARVTQARLKLQQVTSAHDPQAMSQMLAQTVFEGKAIDLSDTRDYGRLLAASLGQEWSGFGQTLFVRPLDLAWRQVLAPAAASLNVRWQSTIVDQWNKAFAGRYPFSATGSDASLPLLAQFLRSDSGRITTFLKTHLGGVLHQEGNQWRNNPSASQGMIVEPAFLLAINQLAHIADTVFTQGDAGVHFELMARPSRHVARMQLTLDEQNLDYFNQMESWQRFIWPGNSYYPGVSLSWRSVKSGMQLYASEQGNWGFIRLLAQAQATPLDVSRTQLVWVTPDGDPLKFIMRSEFGEGPLVLLKLRGFRLPANIFSTVAKTRTE